MSPLAGLSACPLKTLLPHSPVEHAHPEEQATGIRAYKLGKKRWSYNQVEIELKEEGGSRRVSVMQAAHSVDTEFPEPAQDSAICFQLQLDNGHKLQAHIYVVYADRPAGPPGGRAADGPPACSTACSGAEGQYSWRLVKRSDCCRGCQGNILRSIQRFGRLGKRSWNADDDSRAPTQQQQQQQPDRSTMKDPRYMYLSLDEACTHVDAAAFRLVAGIYDAAGERLLATAVSPPIRVLANNDVPTGAARIPLEARLPADWEGWTAEPSMSTQEAPSEAAEAEAAVPAAPAPKRARASAAAAPRRTRLSVPVPACPAATTVPSPAASSGRDDATAGAVAPAAQQEAAAEALQQQLSGGAAGVSAHARLEPGISCGAISNGGSPSVSLPEQQHPARVVIMSRSAWLASQAAAAAQQQPAGSSNPAPGHGLMVAPRPFSVRVHAPTAPAGHRQSPWERLQQQRQAASEATSAGAPAPAAANGTSWHPFSAGTHTQPPALCGPSAGEPREAAAFTARHSFTAAAEPGSGGSHPAWPLVPAHSHSPTPHSGSLTAEATLPRVLPLATGASCLQPPQMGAAAPLAMRRSSSLLSVTEAPPQQPVQQQEWVAYRLQPATAPAGSDTSAALHYASTEEQWMLQQQAAGLVLGQQVLNDKAAAWMAVAGGQRQQAAAAYSSVDLRAGGCAAPAPAMHPPIHPVHQQMLAAAAACGTDGTLPTFASSSTPTSRPLDGQQMLPPPPRAGSPNTLQGILARDSMAQPQPQLQPAVPNAATPTPVLAPALQRRAALLQHADQQMQAAWRVAAARASLCTLQFQQQPSMAGMLKAQQQAASQQHHCQLASSADRLAMPAQAQMPLEIMPSCIGVPSHQVFGLPAGEALADCDDGMQLLVQSSAGFGSLLDVGPGLDDLLAAAY